MQKWLLALVASAALALPVLGYEWVRSSEGWALFRDSSQVGYLDGSGTYFPRLGPGRFGPASQSPVATPGHCCPASRCECEPEDCQCGKTKGLCCNGCSCAVAEGPLGLPKRTPNYGVSHDKVNHGLLHLNGRLSHRDEVLKAIKASVPDDTKKNRVTVIGNADARSRVYHDIATAPEWKDKLLVQEYAPEEWPVAQAGFKTSGNPTVYVQAPDGRVLHRQDAYSTLDDLAQALRRADPNYDPAKDPDLRNPPKPPAPDPVPVPAPSPSPGQRDWLPYLAIGGGVVVLILATLLGKKG